MNRMDWLAGCFALVAGAACAHAMGCSNGATDCANYPNANGCGTGTGGSSTTSTSTSTSSSSGTGGTSLTCTPGNPSPPVTSGNTMSGNIRDECAVFVNAASTATSPAGTMEAPYKTLADAITNANGKPVFACKAMPFTEAVTLSAKLELYGGLDCTTDPTQWTWTATDRSEIDGPADTVAMTIPVSADGSTVSGWTIKAAAPSSLTNGGSSIAVAIDDMPVTGVSISQCDISADVGATGVTGALPTGTVMVGADAASVNHPQMDACINQASLIGGVPGTTMCPDGTGGMVDTSGGAGGLGGIVGTNNGNGANGGAGGPVPSPNPTMAGVGGTGQAGTATMCQAGTAGLAGTPGANGSAGSGPVTLMLTGLNGGDGGDGAMGQPGQGGGGGGGAESGSFCPGSVPGDGASGGGAGAGGCGGNGGGGGKAGGSSIAILSLGTKLTIDGATVTLTTKAGGAGGNGVTGQNGAQGGTGANGGAAASLPPSIAGCAGAGGGSGGLGGPGGGGLGGFSAGIAYAKTGATKPTFTSAPTIGAAGTGGMPGAASGNMGASGGTGVACDFSTTIPTCM
jgi:hypothetical protein